MDKGKLANLELRAIEASNILITTRQISPKYQIIRPTISVTSDTGHLELFRVEPVQFDELPTFSGRWDLRPNTVDIDLIGDAASSRAFRNEDNGYRGHHTRAVSNSPQIYQIDIYTPAGHVFTGTITLNIGLGLFLKDSFVSQDFAQVKVIPVDVAVP